MNPLRRLLWGICALAAIIVVGTGGYIVIEGWPFLDALYMTIITITTVGYAEVHPLSTSGQTFSIFLIIGGVGGALYTLTAIIGYIIEGQFGTTLERRRMKARIAKLKGHFILCGYGRVGEEIARKFKEEGIPFIIIDNQPERVALAEQSAYLYLQGDATSDEVLREAGANRIVSPHGIGGRHMAMLALRPAVVDFIDTVTHGRGRELQLEDVGIGGNSSLVGLTMKAARSKTAIAILATRKKSGKFLTNPHDEEIIEDGDRLIVIGTKERLAALEEALEGVKAS
ncbi:hypothetical protein ES703_11050 [subsurface metagenome]